MVKIHPLRWSLYRQKCTSSSTPREADLREKALQELGAILLECGAETLEAGKLKRLVKRASAMGLDAALERLGATP
ncbi:DUF6437 family protein [Croceicoccus bisphenolivorans]|uniref:DUF6437 family protein n=1 Tax=Croceicoccus bisphenolivorans TaxID=1783232 RepID=UPI0008364DA3